MEREDLYKLRKGLKNIEQLKDQIAMLELRRISPRSAAYGSERVQASGKGDIQDEQLIKIESLIATYRHELDYILGLQSEFESMIAALEPMDKLIMRSYYIEGLMWEEVWQKTGYSTRHLKRKNSEILTQLFAGKAKDVL